MESCFCTSAPRPNLCYLTQMLNQVNKLLQLIPGVGISVNQTSSVYDIEKQRYFLHFSRSKTTYFLCSSHRYLATFLLSHCLKYKTDQFALKYYIDIEHDIYKHDERHSHTVFGLQFYRYTKTPRYMNLAYGIDS